MRYVLEIALLFVFWSLWAAGFWVAHCRRESVEWKLVFYYVPLILVSPTTAILGDLGVGSPTVLNAVRVSVVVPATVALVMVLLTPILLRMMRRSEQPRWRVISTVTLWTAWLSLTGVTLWNLVQARHSQLWQQALVGLLAVAATWHARRVACREDAAA